MGRKVYYFDMDGVLANFHKEPYSYANAISREWIANLDPFMGAIGVVKRLIAEGKSVYISLRFGLNKKVLLSSKIYTYHMALCTDSKEPYITHSRNSQVR